MTHRPFTVPHFRAWALGLVLDSGDPWVIEPFQAAFLRDLFTGTPEAWLIMPEGNAKTTLMAGMALYHIEHMQGGAVPVAASSRDQAEIMFRQADGFVERSDLKGFKCLEGYRRIRFDANDARIQIFAADDRTGDGIIPTLAFAEELHRHRDMRLYRTWRGKLDKRGGQLVAISTAGEPGSEFEQARELIRQTATTIKRKGSFLRAASSSLVLHEWAVPEDGDIEDLRAVKRANPLKAMTRQKLAAKFETPTMTLTHWKRFVCNQPTRASTAAIGEAEWEAAETDERIPGGVPVWLGLDVAWKWDTTAIVPYWYRDEALRLLGPATVLTPPRDGRSLDPKRVELALTEIHERNPIHTVVMDPSRAEQLAEWISETFGSTVIERGQTPAFAVVDYEKFMEGLRSGWLKHTGDKSLTQHVMNAVARVDRFGATRFDRSSTVRTTTSEQERRVIDALSAAAMVNAQAAIVEPVSVYEERGAVEV